MDQVTVNLTPDRTQLVLRFPYDERLVNLARLLPGRRWNRSLGAWTVPFTRELSGELPMRFPNTQVLIGADVDEKLKELTAIEERARFLKSTTLTSLPKDFAFSPNFPPMKHQEKAEELLLVRKNFALFMEMGTGKTYVVLSLINYLKDPKPWLILCPSSVAFVWEDQARQFYPNLRIKVLQGSIKQRAEILRSEPADIYVLNYEATWRMEKELLAVKWGGVCLDESTRVSNRTAKQSKSTFKIGALADRRVILTGTPIPNSPLQLFSQFYFLDSAILGPHFYAFRDRYAIMGGFQGYQVIGWKNTQELLDKIQNHSFRVLKKDCLDLPEKVYEVRKLELEGSQKKAYDELAHELVTEIEGDKTVTAQQIITKVVKLREITAGFIKTDDGTIHYFKEAAKLKALEDIINDLSDKEKVVVWCSFRPELSQIAQRLRDIAGPEGVLELHGDVPASKRGELIHRFQDTGVRFLVAQQEAGGLGISLTSASNCVFSTNDYSPEIRLQAEDRLHRKGQVNKVVYHDLICKGTIDTAVRAALKKKQKLSDLLTGTMVEKIVFGEDF